MKEYLEPLLLPSSTFSLWYRSGGSTSGNLVDHTGNMFYAPAFSALWAVARLYATFNKSTVLGRLQMIGLLSLSFSSG